MMLYSALLACVLFCTSCSLGPAPDRAVFSHRFPERFSTRTHGGNPMPVTWCESFPDAALQKDVREMGLRNYEVAAARSRVAQAAAAYGVSKAALYPSGDATASGERSRIREDRDSRVETLISFGQALNWELDIWGRLRAKKKAAGLTLSEQSALAGQTLVDLQTLLVETWISHHTSQRLEALLGRQQETNTRFLALTELRFAQGQGSALDVLRQRGRLEAVKRELPRVVSRGRQAANAYAVLMGRMPGSTQLPASAWPCLSPLNRLPAPDALMMRRPDLRAAFFALRAADQEVAAAVADRMPRLSIGLGISVTGNAMSAIGDGGKAAFTTGLLAPVFDAGRRKMVVSEKKALVSESLADLEQAMRVAVREVEDGVVLESALFRERDLLEVEIAHNRQIVAEARQHYINGWDSYLGVLDALETYQAILREKVILEQDIALNRARLLKALGASWQPQMKEGNHAFF